MTASLHRQSPARPARPGRRRRFFARLVAIALVCCFMPIFVFGATVAATGTVSVRVQDSGPDGVNLFIPVPAVLLDAAVFVAPAVIPEGDLEAARMEAAPYLPMLRRLANELTDIPAGSVLVHVDNPEEQILITKGWRNFEISVDSGDTQVHVSVPARLMKRSLSVFG
ncbi:MAG: hypothetical protein AAGF23_06530 [Acidobacteriota bacterium]